MAYNVMKAAISSDNFGVVEDLIKNSICELDKDTLEMALAYTDKLILRTEKVRRMISGNLRESTKVDPKLTAESIGC